MASGHGMEITINNGDIPIHAYGFGEDQARYVISVSPDNVKGIITAARDANVAIKNLGIVQGNTVNIKNTFTITLNELLDAHSTWMPKYMSNKD
jgi:phosphoribosylformylglycinamidine (FGAM) synthase-like enzyme